MDITAVRTAFHRAEDQFQRGDFEGAFQSYRDLMVARLQAGVGAQSPATGLDVVALERLSDLAVLYGFYTPAVNLLQAVRAWYAASSNLYCADFTALKLASVYRAQGLIRDAYAILLNLHGAPGNIDDLEFTESALKKWESGHGWTGAPDEISLMFSRLYLEMAHIHLANGQYRCALTAAARGLQHGQGEISLQAKPAFHLVIATANLESGDLLGAYSELDNLEAQLDQQPNPALAVQRDELLGKLHLLQGELGLAKESFERVIKTCQQGSFPLAELNASLNLASILIILNQTQQATRLIQRVKTAVETNNHARLQIRAELLEYLASGRARSFLDGISIGPSVLQMWGGEESPPIPLAAETSGWPSPMDIPACQSYLASFEDRTLGFHFLLDRSDWATAEIYLDELNAAFGETDSILIHTLLDALRSNLLYYQNEIDKAYSGFSRVRDAFIDMQATGLLWQVYRSLSWCETRAGHQEAAALLRAQTDDVLNRLTLTLPPPERAIYQLNKWTVEEEFLAGEFVRLAAVRQQAQNSGILRRLILKWKLTRDLLRFLGYLDRYQSEIGARVAGARPAPLWNRFAVFRWMVAHGRKRTTFRFVVLPDQVIVIHVRALSIDFAIAALSRIQLRDAVRHWHESVLEGATGQMLSDILDPLAYALTLPAFLSTLPPRIRQIRFMPDDVLHGLPFSALPYGGQYLVERFSISVEYIMSGVHSSAPKKGEALVAAVLKGTEDYPPIKVALEEATAVSDHFSTHGIASRNEFDPTSDSLIRLLPESRFFHIVCHGRFRVDAPDQSGFVLIQGNQEEFLTLRQLHTLDLRRVEQAVLASCWSADNFLLPGRWVISLPQTLRAAGVRSVVANLWEVDDRLAPMFLARYYDRLVSLSRAEALRQTQLDCLHGLAVGFDVSNPIHWSGYSLYGATNRVRLPSQKLNKLKRLWAGQQGRDTC